MLATHEPIGLCRIQQSPSLQTSSATGGYFESIAVALNDLGLSIKNESPLKDVLKAILPPLGPPPAGIKVTLAVSPFVYSSVAVE
jgi:hypothetical protein